MGLVSFRGEVTGNMDFYACERICLDLPCRDMECPWGGEKRGKGKAVLGLPFNSSVPSSGLGQADLQSQQPALTSRVGTEPEEAVAFPKATQGQRKSPT